MKDAVQTAKNFGVELSRLLSDCPLKDDEKRAWAELVPYMTLDELERFRGMLLSHLERTVFDQSEDVILALKAEALRKEFAHSHNQMDTSKALDALEREISAQGG